MLEWLFSWLKRSGSGTGGEGDTTNMSGMGKSVFITTSMPLQWMYIGLRAGWTPWRQHEKAHFNDALFTEDPKLIGDFWQSYNAALSFSVAFFPESVPFFSRFCLQLEGIFNYDLDPVNVNVMTISPAALLKFQFYRQGNLLFSVLGGGYIPFAIDNTIADYLKTKKEDLDLGFFPVGWTVGLNFAAKLDPLPGLFFIDLRYSNNAAFSTYVNAVDNGYKRTNAVTVGIGYEYGLITKK